MLNDTIIRKAKPDDKMYRLSDTHGLVVQINPTGSKLWRYRYRFAGKEKMLALGSYPDVSLAEARAMRDKARTDLKNGLDPSLVKKIDNLSIMSQNEATFERVAREWHDLNKGTWVARHSDDIINSLERDVFPALGNLPIKAITPPQVLAVLRLIENRPAIETARRIRQRISAVFVYGIATGRADNDPSAIVQNALAPLKKGRHPAITNLKDAREILQKVDQETAHPVTKLAMRILALTAVRPGTLITTPWDEFNEIDPQDPVWRIPAQRMKLRLAQKSDENRDHLVPLSKQAMEAILTLQSLTGAGPLAFPNTRFAHKSMSENALGYLLNRAGYHSRHVPHGWRSTFSSVMNETYPADKAIIDLMLAHTPANKVEAAYNRALHLARRKELAQIWTDLLLETAISPSELLHMPRR